MSVSEAPLFTRGYYFKKFTEEGKPELARAFAGHTYVVCNDFFKPLGLFLTVFGVVTAILVTLIVVTCHAPLLDVLPVYMTIGLITIPGFSMFAVAECKKRSALKESLTEEMANQILESSKKI